METTTTATTTATTTTATTTAPPPKTPQMPIGYRFCPTDEEIIIHYLRPKVFNFPLPATAIVHSDDLLRHHPSHLPGDVKEKRYFFHRPCSGDHGSNPNGYWKPTVRSDNTHDLILATGCNHPIGFKKSFVFYEFSDHRRSGSRTSWILHQFSLLYPLPIKMQEWVVCSVHMKSKNMRNQHQGQAKRLKRSYCENVEIQKVEDDDSCSGITFDDDLGGGRKEEEEDEEESRVN